MLNVEQGTDAWAMCRLGKVTASRVADVIAKTKSGVSASRATYMGQLIAERLTNTPQDGYTSPAMAWGTLTEDEARAAYEFETGCKVESVGFVDHPEINHCGASPDGLVNHDGLVEIKCPNTATHIQTFIGKAAPSKYIVQMQWQMACTGRDWCDFVSYDPRLPDRMRLFIKRVHRDDKKIAELQDEVRTFIAEMFDQIAELEKAAEKEAA